MVNAPRVRDRAHGVGGLRSTARVADDFLRLAAPFQLNATTTVELEINLGLGPPALRPRPRRVLAAASSSGAAASLARAPAPRGRAHDEFVAATTRGDCEFGTSTASPRAPLSEGARAMARAQTKVVSMASAAVVESYTRFLMS